MDAIPGRPETTGSTVVYRNPWMSVREDTFRRPDGSAGVYGVVDKQDFSIVIAEADIAGSGPAFHLVEQYRYPLSRRAWEFPMGTWPAGAGGSPLELARAELREETGVRAEEWRHLGHLNEAGGFCSQGFDVFHATGLTAGVHAREASEADMVHALVGEDEFGAMIDDGRVVDAATIAAYLLLLRHRARPST
ncbi:NUDIX hydrolase [Nakamurella flavida]|uniref:NUDIX hydrolase n=1 Tax=Nakamurella flavida TaxID=363630 RepID=A0A938YIG5_9ACTN|nr:NUDIX hydrolase [Nakamurella flavida]MBM9478295.1 NUDIX hydrolase [Nakamurella flavida]MDP9777534.1 8-oxo-dGTP pyrophosphatase MutT (NUDIX family) [Nakamurella flavida]